jgi:hypothetical protein
VFHDPLPEGTSVELPAKWLKTAWRTKLRLCGAYAHRHTLGLQCCYSECGVARRAVVVVVGREGIRGVSLFGSGKLAGVKTHADLSNCIPNFAIG